MVQKIKSFKNDFFLHRYVIDMISDDTKKICRALSCSFLSELGMPFSQSNHRGETGRDGFLNFLG